jgi:hypothetical protein
LLAAIGAFLAMNFNSCNSFRGTEGGNPMASHTAIAVKVGPNTGALVSELALCPRQVRFVPLNADAPTETFALSNGDVSLAPTDVSIGVVTVANQTYKRVELIVSDQCESRKSVRVTNANGSYSTSEETTIRFDGTFAVAPSSMALSLLADNVISELAPVTSNAEVKASAEATAGQATMIDDFSWTGKGADANWTTVENWHGGVPPSLYDTAVFDSNCLSNCSPLIDTSIVVKGIRLLNGYSGTITQGVGKTITLGENGWLQTSGTFAGSNGDISMPSGGFVLGGGSFTSTSGRLSVRYTRDHGPQYAETRSLMVLSGGTFAHNGGLVAIGIDDRNTCTGAEGTVALNGGFNLILNELEISSTNPGCQPSYLDISGSGQVVVLGAMGHQQNYLTGSIPIQVHGDLMVGELSDGGDNSIVLNGTGAQTYTYNSGGWTGRLSIDKASGAVSPAPGTTDLKVGGLSVLQGSFTAPSNMLTVYQLLTAVGSNTAIKVGSGAVYDPNGGTLKLDGDDGTCMGGLVTTIDAPDGFLINNLIITPKACQPNYVSLIPGRTMVVGGNFTQLKVGTDSAVGISGGVWELRGNATFGSPVKGNASLKFTGGANQTISRAGTGVLPSGPVVVDKPGGVLSLGSTISLNSSGQNLTLTNSSYVDLNGRSLSVGGTLTLGVGTTIKLNGGSHSQGVLINNGSIIP